jgi:glycosyltransferase involved in cell wall biosynthesis
VKVLQAGNPNFGYVMARELRKRGIEADLLISKKAISGIGAYGVTASINDPLSHDPNLDSYPEWIIFDDIDKKSKIFHIAKLMKKYDVIHAQEATPIHAMISGKPYIVGAVGDDLRKKAFEKSITGFFLRMAYKKANLVVYVWPILKPAIEKLGIRREKFLPRLWDVSNFSNKVKQEKGSKLTIFSPTAQLWELKGNDKFLRAFSRLCEEGFDVFLYMIDWGKDSSKAKEILNKHPVKDKVKIVPGPVSREEVAHYMSLSDILAEQFNTGSYTRVGIESFFFGLPVLINLDEKVHLETHGSLPDIINAKTEDEIYEKLKYFCKNKSELEKIAQNTRSWAEKEFDMQKNVDAYVEIYQSLLK